MDVRVLAATQVDMDEAVKTGDFRSDLFWRLNVIHVHVPPLRERTEDILYLSRLFVERQTSGMKVKIKGLNASAEAKLLSLPFPGNVRELKNIIERAVALCDGPRLSENDLMPFEEKENKGEVTPRKAITLKESLGVAEREAILGALKINDGAVTRAAESLGISRKNLWEKMKRYGIGR